MTPPSLHRYAYAHVLPTVLTDPDGRIAQGELSTAEKEARRASAAASQKREAERRRAACERDSASYECQPEGAQLLLTLFGDEDSSKLASAAWVTTEAGAGVSFINGVRNSASDAAAAVEEIARTFEAEVTGVWNPTAGATLGGFVRDAAQLFLVDKLGIPDESTRLLIRVLREAVASLPPGEIHTAVAHSQGAAKLSTALGYLSPEERSRIAVVSFGEASALYPSGLNRIERNVSPGDFVPDAFGAGLAFGTPGRRGVSLPLGAHSLKAYLEQYRWLKSDEYARLLTEREKRDRRLRAEAIERNLGKR